MSIDPNFAASRERTPVAETGLDVDADYDAWGPVEPPETLGVHGTHVAVDFDVCTGEGPCLENCPVDVFEWVETPGHPASEVKAVPVDEAQCIDCMLCVDVCPVDAIDVDGGRA
ncbi:ferredoxin family protein [Halomarina halobia]|uniref:Ferredoxin family protein n=1 Tax=Halomarina halobia TaxID=3033386 RepID=A0ABD6A8J0_9EURY|nr:ferredoxin family protein [Halomarina sp. PSR21]